MWSDEYGEKIEIDNRPMTHFQWLIVAMCVVLNFNDGIDVLLVSFSSSEIIKAWGLSKSEMGYVFSAGLMGMTLGCFAIAPLADRHGRRNIFLVSLTMITLGMLGVWACRHFGLMLLLRFVTGLGIGGILPTMTATAAEFSNKKYRDFNVGLVQAGWPIGAILTGLFCAYYIPKNGWHWAFLVAGCISALMLLLVYFFMTDSLEFMLNNPAKTSLQKINRLRQKLKLVPLLQVPPQSESRRRRGVKILFSDNYQDSTMKVWIAAFFGFLTLYTLMSWVPNIAKESGLSFQVATYVGIMLNAGAAAGSASIGAIGNRFGLRQSQFTFMLVAFLIMMFYAFLTLTTTLIFTLIFLIGFFVQGGFNGLWPTLSRIYPASIRATGVGFTVGVGRFGAILGPWLFGLLQDYGLNIATLFVLFSMPLLVMGGFIWLIKPTQLHEN